MPAPPAVEAIRPIHVLLASPNDVADERRAACRIVRSLNASLRDYGWEVLLHGWESDGPTGGRPQENINPRVRSCEIFLGILWKRWGTPTGESSSGFAEEWTIALDRFERTGTPDLWLYFKEPGEDAVTDEGVASVLAFRDRVQQAEVAFVKPFTDLADFENLFRERLLNEVLRKTELTHSQIGVVPIDWSSAYGSDPVSLLAHGPDRLEEAEGVVATDPARAAGLFSSLAAQIAELGFMRLAGGFRMRAAAALLIAEDPAGAVGMLRRVLSQYVWWLYLDDANSTLRELGDSWPPELAVELRIWRDCAAALRDPANAAARLHEALDLSPAFPVDEETNAIWRGVLWRCWLHLGEPQPVVDDTRPLPELTTDATIELNLLRAEAMRTVGSPEADRVWQSLRLRGLHLAQSDPVTSAWIATRCARDKVAAELMSDAEQAYIDAASRWTNAGRNEQAALAFFSAQVAGGIADAWNYMNWTWREAAANQRETARSFASRARELETQALSSRSDRDPVLPWLRGAYWLAQRAGLFQIEMRELGFAADEFARQRDAREAVRLYCQLRDGKRAQALAQRSTNQRAILDGLLGEWPKWTREARCDVIGQIGRCASPEAARELLPMVLDSLEPSGRTSDNTHRSASEALAQLALVLNEDTAIADRLLQLASERDLTLATSGRFGLRMLRDIGREIDVDALIEIFARERNPQEPTPQWVADHLTTPERIASVRAGVASAPGHLRALTALATANVADHDPELRAHFRTLTEKMLASEFGMTKDGSGMIGLLALQPQGLFAAATADPELMAASAAAFLNYALTTRWPMNNRVSAVLGLWPLIEPGSDEWLQALRPLADPDSDLDDESPRHMEMWSQRGDLEAAAIEVCSSHKFADQPPDWLDRAVRNAAFDEREPMRAVAWYAAARGNQWFDPVGARYALLDQKSSVRAAALYAWRAQSDQPLPDPVALRLLDGDARMRLALLHLINVQPNQVIADRLLNDPDAYIRGRAKSELGC